MRESADFASVEKEGESRWLQGKQRQSNRKRIQEHTDKVSVICVKT